jgi:hypothetical protein
MIILAGANGAFRHPTRISLNLKAGEVSVEYLVIFLNWGVSQIRNVAHCGLKCTRIDRVCPKQHIGNFWKTTKFRELNTKKTVCCTGLRKLRKVTGN